MTATAAKMSAREAQLAEIIGVTKGRAKTADVVIEQVAEGDPRFADIASNPFFKAVFDEPTSPEEKIAAGIKLLTFANSREQNRANVAAFDLFFPEFVTGPIGNTWQRCDTISYGVRIKTFMKRWEIYPYMLGKYMWDIWAGSKVFYDLAEARAEAWRIHDEHGWTEYGVGVIDATKYSFT